MGKFMMIARGIVWATVSHRADDVQHQARESASFALDADEYASTAWQVRPVMHGSDARRAILKPVHRRHASPGRMALPA